MTALFCAAFTLAIGVLVFIGDTRAELRRWRRRM